MANYIYLNVYVLIFVLENHQKTESTLKTQTYILKSMNLNVLKEYAQPQIPRRSSSVPTEKLSLLFKGNQLRKSDPLSEVADIQVLHLTSLCNIGV